MFLFCLSTAFNPEVYAEVEIENTIDGQEDEFGSTSPVVHRVPSPLIRIM